jgi:PleD family two-component response regulator
MANIQHSLESETRYPFQPSISFGVATKRVESENLDKLLYDADVAMYKEKGDRRRKD